MTYAERVRMSLWRLPDGKHIKDFFQWARLKDRVHKDMFDELDTRLICAQRT